MTLLDSARRRWGWAGMRLYFHLVNGHDFHLVNGHEILRDQVGVEVADLSEAFAEVLQALAGLWHEDPSAPQDWSGWTLKVTAGSGAVVLSVDLNSDMVASHRLKPPQLKPSANPSELDLLRLLLLRRSREPDQREPDGSD